jgi:hypothetical protein
MKYPLALAVFAATLLQTSTIYADLGGLSKLKISKDSLTQKAKDAAGEKVEEKKQGVVGDAKVTEINQLPKDKAELGSMMKTSVNKTASDAKDEAHKAAEEKAKLKLGL